MEFAQGAISTLDDLVALLNAHKAELGSWEAVASRIPGVSDETLRKISEGLTKRPTRETRTLIIGALATPPLPPGQAAELREALRLAREAVSILERLDSRQPSQPVSNATLDAIVRDQQQADASAKRRRKGAGE